MADIGQFIDKDLVNFLVKTNEQLVLMGTNIDNLIPSIKKIEGVQSKLGKTTKDNADERKKLTETEKDAAKIAKQLETNEKKLISLQKGQQDALIKTKTEIQKTTKATKDLQRVQAAQRGSTEQLAAVNVILEKRLRNVNQTTDKGKKSADLLRSAIDKNNEKITEQSSAFVKTKRGIGGYTEGIKEAFGELGIFGGALSKVSSFQEKFNKLITGSGKSFKAAAQGTKGASKALRIFKVALISTGIGLIVVAIGAFVALLSKTQKFTDALNVALSAVGAVMDVLVGTVSRLAGVFSKLFKQPLSETFKEAGEAVDGLSDSIVEAAKKGAELERLRQSVKRLGFEFDVSNAKAIQQIELLKAIADDATKSFAERKKANQDAIIAQEKASAAEFELFSTRKKLADAEFKRLKETGNLNDEAREAHSIATKEFIDAETQRLLIQRDLEKQRTELKQDELEKDLDILIDGFDNQKTINERLIADDTLTLKKREGILNETRDLFEKTFAEQIGTIEQFTNESVNANDLIATSDAVVLNEKIRSLGLSEIIEGRLLEIIRERRIAIQDLNEAEQDLAKVRIDDLKAIEDASDKEFETHIENLEAGIDAEIEAEENKQERLLTAEVEGLTNRNKAAEDAAKEQVRIDQERANNIADISSQLGVTLGDFASGRIESFKDLSKQLLLISLDALKKQLLIDQVAILAREVAAKSFAGIATAAVLIGVVQASFAGLSGIIQGFEKGTEYAPGGVAELAEAGRERVINPDGTVWTAENRGLYNLAQGSKVLTNTQTKQAELNDSRMVKGLSRIERAVKNQPRQRTESQFDKRQRGMKDGYHMMKNRLN